MFSTHGGTLVIKNLTLSFMMSFAYDLPARQIMGKPGWMDTDKWDIEAKADTPGELNTSQTKLMMQKLFAERFGLQVHEEKRKMAAYVLSVSKDGPKMTKADRRVVIARPVVVPSRRDHREKPQPLRISRRR